ncbi:MAG: hypothetical protein ACXAD7_07250 [Candidatus Kariarchaeaceae archaeon]
MKKLIGFMFRKINTHNLRFHYLRVGKAGQLLDRLRDESEVDVEWIQHETETFGEYHFGKSYEEYDGAIVNLSIDDDIIATMRRDFWEQFIWKTQDNPLVLALVIPDSSKYGTLTKSQVFEGLSLIRLTDRPFDIFENKEGSEAEIVTWLTRMTALVHKQERLIEESS